jgi:hypothetical protein
MVSMATMRTGLDVLPSLQLRLFYLENVTNSTRSDCGGFDDWTA